MNNEVDRKHRPVQSVMQAIAILDALGKGGGKLGVTALSRATGINKTSTYNLLHTLEVARFVVRDGDAATYSLGWRLYEFGMQAVAGLDLARGIRPFLDKLAGDVGETALAGVLEGHEALYIEKSESDAHGLRLVVQPGLRVPLHANATGKVLLAFQDDAFIDQIMRSGLKTITPNTIVDPDRLRERITAIRELGYAYSEEESERGLAAVAMPVRDHTGAVVAAITVAGAQERFDESTVPSMVAVVRRTVDEVEQWLGREGNPA